MVWTACYHLSRSLSWDPDQHHRPVDTDQSLHQLSHSHLSLGPQVSPPSIPPTLSASSNPYRPFSLSPHINYNLSPLREPPDLWPQGLQSLRGQKSFSPLRTLASLRRFRLSVWSPAAMQRHTHMTPREPRETEIQPHSSKQWSVPVSLVSRANWFSGELFSYTVLNVEASHPWINQCFSFSFVLFSGKRCLKNPP